MRPGVVGIPRLSGYTPPNAQGPQSKALTDSQAGVNSITMSQVFLLQNQRKHLLSKQGEWVNGREAGSLYRTVHRDEALNQMIEVNARDYTLRIKILECTLNDRGLPLLKDEDLPPLVESDVSGAEDAPLVEQQPEVEEQTADANINHGDDPEPAACTAAEPEQETASLF